jgi:ABC-type multidrug transport system fused ATPase/permease subunit
LNVRSLRSIIGLVSQEPVLLSLSILENIALGLVASSNPEHAHLRDVLLSGQLRRYAESISTEDASQQVIPSDIRTAEIVSLIQAAAVSADAAEFISALPRGYATIVGNGSGTQLSGGQRQRIALARALVRNPRVLVLDEATSALDAGSESRVRDAVFSTTIGNASRTVISVAHRLATVKDADNIIVLKDGEVVEQGTYDELIAANGVFARLVTLQSLGFDDDEDEVTVKASSDSITKDTGNAILSEKNAKIEHASYADQSATKEVGSLASSDTSDHSSDPIFVSLPLSIIFRSLGTFIRPSLLWVALALISAIVVGMTYSASGLIFGFTVGELNPCSTSVSRIIWLGQFFSGLIFMLACVELLANICAWSSFGVISERVLYAVRILSFRSLMNQPVSWHQQSSDTSPSNLLSIITKDTASLGALGGSTIGTIFSIIINFLAAIILSHIMAWKLALVCLVAVPILLGSGIMQLRSLSRFEERHTAAYSAATSLAVEAISAIPTVVAALSLEDEVAARYSHALAGPRREMVVHAARANIWLAVSNSIGFLVYAFAYWWGSRLIMSGEITTTQFFIVVVAMLVSAQLWGQMFVLAPEVSRARAAVGRIINVVRLGGNNISSTTPVASLGPEDDVESKAAADLRSLASPSSDKGVKVVFDNVSFAYPTRPDIQVLSEVSFTIQPGQFVGLVGPSGAGKSTIMKLVQRLCAPSSGRITIDVQDISAPVTTAKAFRSDVAVVPQDTALFEGSIRFNVGLGAAPGHEASDAEIQEACRLAGLHDTIVGLPEGYDTEVGSRAGRLSGGQRQRLSIARALVRRPRLLLLDESTSALDAESERALQEGLEEVLSQGKTTVVAITHRLHTVKRADIIFVIEGGKIVDSGTHIELVERNDNYRASAQQQMLHS